MSLIDVWRNASKDERLELLNSAEFTAFLAGASTSWGAERALLLDCLGSANKRIEQFEYMQRISEIESGLSSFEPQQAEDAKTPVDPEEAMALREEKEEAELDHLSFDSQCERLCVAAMKFPFAVGDCMPFANRLVSVAAAGDESVFEHRHVAKVRMAIETIRLAVTLAPGGTTTLNPATTMAFTPCTAATRR